MGVLKLDHVTKRFGGLVAVDDLSFDLPEGKIYGLIGPNGAGKTTVFNLITGIYEPTEGSILLSNELINGKKPSEITKKGCARTFQNLRMFKRLSVLDNILVSGQLHNADYTYYDAIFKTGKYREQERLVKEKAMELLDIVGLADKQDERVINLPYGFQRKMEIARALATQPKVLLLDEPAAGMNPEESLELMDMIDRIRKQFKLSVLLIEHHMELVMGICEHIIVLNFGATIAEGSAEMVQSHPAVIEAYLGKGDEKSDA